MRGKERGRKGRCILNGCNCEHHLYSICVLRKTSTLVTFADVSLLLFTLPPGLTESALWNISYRMVLMSMPGIRGMQATIIGIPLVLCI